VKHHIYTNVPRAKLTRIVPKRFHARLHGLPLPHELYTLVVFSGAKDEVVQSGTVRKALADVAGGQPILAVATGFSGESHDVCRARDAEIVVLSEFEWTDGSYQSVRQGR
jgi:hypothetical protein